MPNASANPTSRAPLVRIATTTAGAIGLLLASTSAATAQASAAEGRTWEFRISSGSFIPTGDQRDALKSAQVTAAQVSWVLRPSLAITGTFGWARSRDLTSVNSPKLDVFTSDVGIEARPITWFANGPVSIRPFAGFGAGARSYNHRTLDESATHNVAGYGAVGGELGMGRVAVRLEARDYVTGFKPLTGAGTSHTRNDVHFTVALSINRSRK